MTMVILNFIRRLHEAGISPFIIAIPVIIFILLIRWGKKKDKEKEEAEFKEMVKTASPSPTLFHVAYGQACLKSSKYQEAIENFTKAMDNGFFEVCFYRGVAYFNLGKKQEAFQDFLGAGLIYLKTLQSCKVESKEEFKKKAFECIDYMKKIDPSSHLIKELMDEIYKVK